MQCSLCLHYYEVRGRGSLLINPLSNDELTRPPFFSFLLCIKKSKRTPMCFREIVNRTDIGELAFSSVTMGAFLFYRVSSTFSIEIEGYHATQRRI